jgi:transposase
MPKSPSWYPEEFRQKMLELMRSGRSVGSLVREFKVSRPTLTHWRKQAELDSGQRTDGLKTDEKTELARLRRENAQLREEREILKKAAAWFAQEAVPTRKLPSDS